MRFPRPRGDGPVWYATATRYPGVSPPTRGWTSSITESDAAAMGFPAHAGMDLEAPQPLQTHTWFPRPRGDGPPVTMTTATAVSPPTRGWTTFNSPSSPISAGFPAHAGMDQRGSELVGPCPWFPRPRGDGPWKRGKGDGWERVSPPTRGWTRKPAPPTAHGRGFPAHAGMDRLVYPCGSLLRRFPRPRGDGPLSGQRVRR